MELVMRKVALLFAFVAFTFLLLPVTLSRAHAQVLCIRGKVAVKNQKLNLKKAIIVADSACPKGFLQLTSIGVASNSISSQQLQDGSVTTPKLASAAVTSSKLAPGAVASQHLQDGSVTALKLASGVLPNAISINPAGAFLKDATFHNGFGQHGGITMPDAVVSSFSAGFTVPPNYTPGTTISGRLLALTLAATPCTVKLRPDSIAVSRAGSTPLVGISVSDGLNMPFTTLNFAVTKKSIAVNFSITAPDGSGLLPGDSVIFSMFRAGTDSADTCAGHLKIQGIELQYQ